VGAAGRRFHNAKITRHYFIAFDEITNNLTKLTALIFITGALREHLT
jgi:hypothetical protein